MRQGKGYSDSLRTVRRRAVLQSPGSSEVESRWPAGRRDRDIVKEHCMPLAPDRVDYSPIIDRPVIRWPNGATERIAKVDADRLVVIREGAGIQQTRELGRK